MVRSERSESSTSFASAANTASATTHSPAERRRNQKKQLKTSVCKMVGRVFMPIRGCNKFVANVIDQLHQNDSEFRLLKLDGSHTRLNFRKLIEAIDRNTTVTQVQIHGGLVANLPQREQHEIWNALGNLPNLEEADFKYFTEAPLHLDGINCFLARA